MMLRAPAGVTGCIGTNVVTRLMAQGYDVRAMRCAISSLDAPDGLERDCRRAQQELELLSRHYSWPEGLKRA